MRRFGRWVEEHGGWLMLTVWLLGMLIIYLKNGW